MAVEPDQVLTVRELREVLSSLSISHPQLESRLHAVLRRARRFTLGGIVFDTATRQAFAQGRPLELTRREAALLEEFLRAPGHILAKAGSTNALEAAVSRLRRKLTAAAVALQIETRWGIGYCLTEVAPE